MPKGTRTHCLALLIAGGVVPASFAQLDEDFNSVSETGGVTILDGAGFNAVPGWDDGILGEAAFAGTGGNASITASAAGDANGGVGGSGAGVVSVVDAFFDLLNVSFSTVTGVGGGTFLAGNGLPDTFNFTLNWDDGITGEGAFGGTFGGAVLNGSMAAQGITTGGNPGGAGQLVVTNVTKNAGDWFAGLQWTIGSLPGAVALANPGFEAGGTGFGISGWTTFGNVFTEPVAPRTGTKHAKMFGTFSGPSGFFQSLAAQPGQTWELDAYSFTLAADSIAGGDNFVVMKIEYYNAANAIILQDEVTILDGASPTSTWIDNAPLQLTAPAGTVRVQPVFVFVQTAFQGGSAYIDDVTFRQVGGPPTVDLADFTLSANVQGVAGGGGQALGNYQLRIEDTDGNRLLFRGLANGSYQSIGGALNTAIEADSSGAPASGVFNANSPSFTVVVAFDNDFTNDWGTGGTLNADNVVVGNSDSAGSFWFAALNWDDLVISETDPSQVALTADVKGSVTGGTYELRLEGIVLNEAGLDNDFATLTGVGGDILLDDTSVDPNNPAPAFNFTNDWDTGITGESAFAGTVGNAFIFPGGGVTVQGVTTGGAYGEISVLDIVFGVGGGWFGGITFPNQALASTDLSQVTLTADIRGLANGGGLGDYELRIEDPEGDRMYFAGTANGSFQSVGGTLDTATFGTALDGSSNGVFDLDAPNYAVVIAFANEAASWGTGGILQVDNVFLTPVTTRTEIGEVRFRQTANGAFQSVGGALDLGDTDFGDNNQNFAGGTGVGGGFYYNPGDPNSITAGPGFDTGLEGEAAFAGTFGTGTLATASAEVCATCGVSGGKAARLAWTGSGGSGYFLGLVFDGLRVDLSGGLAGKEFRAQIRGSTNGVGSTLGGYILRLEDAETDFLSFTATANGSFQLVGGDLGTATPGSTPDGDGAFNFNQGVYKAVLVVVEPDVTPSWGTGGELIIDDLFLTGVNFADADVFNVVLAFEESITTWGTSGTLTIDNLNVGPAAAECPGDIDGNGVINLDDLLLVLGSFGSGPGGDADGDGDTDLDDLLLVLGSFNQSCP